MLVDGRAVRPLRGRVVVRSEDNRPLSDILWTPKANERDTTAHYGTVLAMGDPAQTSSGIDVDPGFRAGARIVFVWNILEKAWSQQWGNEQVAVIPQEAVLAVIER
jgi:co-chaperonin GroES (HSP10)